MGDENEELNLVRLLEKDWFYTVLGPYVSLADLPNLTKLSMQTEVAIEDFWPSEIREFARTQCGEHPHSMLIFGIHGACKARSEEVIERQRMGIFDDFFQSSIYKRPRHPAPIIRFQPNLLAYDIRKKMLVGQPWSELVIRNPQPIRLGRIAPNVCSADDEGSNVFYCGGRNYTDEGGNDVQWLEFADFLDRPSKIAGILNIDEGLWTEVPEMPESRSNAGIFRIGSRIYVVGGETWFGDSLTRYESTLCFDLDQRQWIDPGIDDFPGEAYGNFATCVIGESTALVAGGIVIGGKSKQAFSLNVNTGVWTQLSDLPESVCEGENRAGYTVKPDNETAEGSPVIVCGEAWTKLLPNGEWEVSPDIRGYNLAAIHLNNEENKIFDGNKWIALPPHNNADLMELGVRVGDMELLWNDACTLVRL